MKNPYKKWRDPHVLFLDDGFDCDEAHSLLVAAGFEVERFSLHFRREDGKRAQGILDPSVIALCNLHGWVLITTDAAMARTHRRDIERSNNLGILATAHNTVADIEDWANSLIGLKPKIEQNNFKKRPRPWFGTFGLKSRFGVPVKTLEAQKGT